MEALLPIYTHLLPSSPLITLPFLFPNPISPTPHPRLRLKRPPSPKIRLRASSAGLHETGVDKETSAEKFDWFQNWYPLAPLCDLDKRAPHAKRVLGLDVVVWWDRVGERWQVFDDLCPHRLAPLSEGRIDRWGRLQCVYHGWCFDGAGDCKLIPQAPPDGPPVHAFKKACAAVYPSCVQNKIVWFWPSTNPSYRDVYSEKKPPYMEELDDPSYTSMFASRDMPYGYEVLIENLMDPAHLTYAHYGIMPTPKNLKEEYIKRDREGGRPMEMSIQTLDASGFLTNDERGNGRFVAPCLFYAFRGKDQSTDGSVTVEQPAKTIQKRALLIFMCIPVSPGNSRLIFAFPRNFSLWLDKVLPRWFFHIGLNLMLDSDLYLLHVEERKIADVGNSKWQEACFVPTKSDAHVVGFRRWLRKYGGYQVPWPSKFGPDLPPTPPREQLMDRYWSHVVHCSSCRTAEKGLKVVEVSLQVISIGLVGLVAAMKQNAMSSLARSVIVSMAVVSFLASKWLGNYTYKSFHYHDYNHAFK